MGTKIKDPKANMPTSGRGSGTISGAAQGAAVGADAGPVGMIAGAVIGAAVGFLGGSEADKSAKHATLASKYATIIKTREAAIQRRDMLRQFRIARAMTMMGVGNEEGGTRSSAPHGALAGLQAQFAFNMNFFDAQVYAQRKYQTHVNKAGKHGAAANTIMATGSAVASAAESISESMGSWGGSRGYAGLGQETMASTNVLNTPKTQDFGWIQSPQPTFDWVGPR